MTRHVPVSAAKHAPRRISSDRVLSGYTRWVPILWLGGFHVLFGAVLLLWLFLRQRVTSQRARTLLLVWGAVAGAQAIATAYNWFARDIDLATFGRKLLSLPMLGWLLFGCMLAVGCQQRLATTRLVRSFMILALLMMVMAAVAFAAYAITAEPSIDITTLPGLVADRTGSWRFFTQAKLYTSDEFLGVDVVRLTLFYPYPTILAMAGCFLFFTARLESRWQWRWIGTAGSLCAMVLSFSRAVFIAFAVALCVYLFVRRSWMLLVGLIVATVITLLLLLLAGSDPSTWGVALIDTLRGARSNSSDARDLIYAESWKAFQQSPLFGWGWVGPSVHPIEPLPIGSHSTFYGTLYTGGLVTFCTLLVATVVTVWIVASDASRGNPAAAAGLAMITALVVFSYSESLYTSFLPLSYFLIFLGGVLAKCEPEPPRMLSG